TRSSTRTRPATSPTGWASHTPSTAPPTRGRTSATSTSTSWWAGRSSRWTQCSRTAARCRSFATRSGSSPRSWAELLGEPGAAPEPEEESGGRFFSRLRDSLSKSRRALTGELASAASFDPGNDADWERLEEALIAGDVGVRATAELVRRLEARGELAGLNAAPAGGGAELLGEPPGLPAGRGPARIPLAPPPRPGKP